MAAQVLRPMTATPPRGWNSAGAGLPSIRTTRTTPGTFSAWLSSTLATLPPNTGGRAVYMIDPDGIRVEFIETRRSFGEFSPEEAKAVSWLVVWAPVLTGGLWRGTVCTADGRTPGGSEGIAEGRGG